MSSKRWYNRFRLESKDLVEAGGKIKEGVEKAEAEEIKES